MRYNFKKYGQYKNDIFNKVSINFERGKKLLDVGCGDGSDAEIFIKEFGVDTYGIDIYEHENIKNIKEFKFKKAGIFKIPFEDNFFDYVFLHDVLHHIDEEYQSYKKHIDGLKELKRVCKKDGCIIILEANKYNPLLKTLSVYLWAISFVLSIELLSTTIISISGIRYQESSILYLEKRS